jgi:hypothetical protein
MTSVNKKTSPVDEEEIIICDLERDEGVEPSSLAWKAKVLPIYESRMVRSLGFEPRTLQIYSLLPLTTRPTAVNIRI